MTGFFFGFGGLPPVLAVLALILISVSALLGVPMRDLWLVWRTVTTRPRARPGHRYYGRACGTA